MKNNIFLLILIFILNLNIHFHSYGDELKFEASSLEIIDKDKILIAKDGVKILSGNNIIIDANQMRYDKEKNILNAEGDILAKDTINKLSIKSDKIYYDKNIEKIISSGNVKIIFDNLYELLTEEIIFLKNSAEILVSDEALLKDSVGNTIKVQNLKYLINDKLLKTKNVNLVDAEKNSYNFDNAIIDLLNNQFIGDGVKIDFFESSFGNSENDPRLKGNYIFSDGKTTLIKKGVFTTCKKNEDCPPWQMKAKEIRHDKNKKTINYKDAWLEIYDMPVIYFPKFFHPDPSVKRQSGFLTPQLIDSSSLGISFKLPYYKVISDNKDLTFSPRIFSNNEALFQNEYRQMNKNSEHISDFSLKKKNSDSKTHFFSNTKAKLNMENFDTSEIEFNLETTSSDTYLKSHKIESGITKSFSLLKSFLAFNANRSDLDVEIKLQAYEDLTKTKSSDKFEFLFPSYSFSKNIQTKFDGDLDLISNGFYKNYNTNIFEKVLINDLQFQSTPKISNLGFVNKLNLLFKNVTAEGENSSDYKNEFSSENYGSILYDISYPMKKSGEFFDSFFTAKGSIMYSPNSNKDNKSLDRIVDINNIFTQNRLSLDDSVEGGQSVTLGSEYRLRNKAKNNDILIGGLATVLRDKSEINLPSRSTINNKGSDIIGSLIFEPNNNFKVDYNFSMDNNFESTNYNLLKTAVTVNKFVTSFEFLQEDDEIGSESYISNETGYNFTKSNSLKYRTRRNKKTDFTEFYNLMYEYKNDCLKAAIQYNKDYYSDNELKPTEEIFFSISIVPFTTIDTPSVK